VSPPIVTGAKRRSATQRSAAQRGAAHRRSARRRRSLLVFAVTALAAVGIVLAMPLLRRVFNEFTLPLSNADVIRQQAAEKHLDPALIAGVIYAETKFDARTSSAGAQGLMQILPQTALFLARRSRATTFTTNDLSTPQVNIAYGSYYLRYLLDHYHGNTMLALAAYNGGEANVDRWIDEARGQGRRLWIDEIPFPETRDYVARVLRAQRDYRQTYASELGYR
jgi:soluble lytic murein transglycosylase